MPCADAGCSARMPSHHGPGPFRLRRRIGFVPMGSTSWRAIDHIVKTRWIVRPAFPRPGPSASEHTALKPLLSSLNRPSIARPKALGSARLRGKSIASLGSSRCCGIDKPNTTYFGDLTASHVKRFWAWPAPQACYGDGCRSDIALGCSSFRRWNGSSPPSCQVKRLAGRGLL